MEGLNPNPRQWEYRALTTEPAGNSSASVLVTFLQKKIMHILISKVNHKFIKSKQNGQKNEILIQKKNK